MDAVQVRVRPHRAADSCVICRGRDEVEKIIVRVGRERSEVDGDAVIRGRDAGETGQIRFHDDISARGQIQQFVIARGVSGRKPHQRAVGGVAVGVGVGE